MKIMQRNSYFLISEYVQKVFIQMSIQSMFRKKETVTKGKFKEYDCVGFKCRDSTKKKILM